MPRGAGLDDTWDGRRSNVEQSDLFRVRPGSSSDRFPIIRKKSENSRLVDARRDITARSSDTTARSGSWGKHDGAASSAASIPCSMRGFWERPRTANCSSATPEAAGKRASAPSPRWSIATGRWSCASAGVCCERNTRARCLPGDLPRPGRVSAILVGSRVDRSLAPSGGSPYVLVGPERRGPSAVARAKGRGAGASASRGHGDG